MDFFDNKVNQLRNHLLRWCTKGMRELMVRFVRDLEEYAAGTSNRFDDWVVDRIKDVFNIPGDVKDVTEDD